MLPFICLAIICLSACQPPFKKGIKKFEAGEYYSAIPHFEKAIQTKNKDTGKAAFLLGESYRLSNQIGKALPYYTQALEQKFTTDNLAFQYAFALKANGKYAEALKQLDKYIKTGINKERLAFAKKEITVLRNIEDLTEPNDTLGIRNVEILNTSSAEYAPTIINNTLVFTSTRRKEKIYTGNGDGFADIFVYDAKSGDESPIRLYSPLINLDGVHDACATFTKDGKTVVFARSAAGKRKTALEEVNLFTANLIDGEWTEPELVNISEPKYWDSTPFLAPDGKTLFFASNRPGGYGGIDLYRAVADGNGGWQKPINMGKEINTAGNELFPYVSADRKFYFASDGQGGLGGLDIFVAIRTQDTVLVYNLGVPFNSTADDFGIVFKGENTGYFSSNRVLADSSQKGDDDIYEFFNLPKKIQKKVNYYLEGVAYQQTEEAKQILPQTNIELWKGQTFIGEAVAGEAGKFRLAHRLELEQDYLLIASLDEYNPDTVLFSTVGKAVDTAKLVQEITNITFQTEFLLTPKPKIVVPDTVVEVNVFDKLKQGEEITLYNILYDLNDYRIREDAAKELDKLAKYLNEHPEVNVELGSHTDSRASEAYNLKLSKKRAEAAVKYIISQGVAPERIKAQGYGESRLLIEEAQTEEEHQLNRRTTVQLIK
jgi:peptidoglycan-associated lipoprotein